MDSGLEGAGVVVTGGGSGIGLACAEAFALEGAHVTVLDRNPDARASVTARVGTDAAFVRADVRSESEIQNAVRQIVDPGGGIDILVCCAGVSGPFGKKLDEVTLEEWDDVQAINVRGAFLAAKHCIPHLRRSLLPAIVFLASDSGYVAAPGMAPYCTSKGGLLMLARALSVDLADDGVRVNCVSPSIVDTPLARADLDRPEGFSDAAFPVQAPEQVARLVVMLSSPLAATVNGASLVSDYGFMARSAFPA